MSETVSTTALPDILFKLIQTEKVNIFETNGEIRLTPVSEKGAECQLRGMFAACPEMSVDKFLERKRADRELDL